MSGQKWWVRGLFFLVVSHLELGDHINFVCQCRHVVKPQLSFFNHNLMEFPSKSSYSSFMSILFIRHQSIFPVWSCQNQRRSIDSLYTASAISCSCIPTELSSIYLQENAGDFIANELLKLEATACWTFSSIVSSWCEWTKKYPKVISVFPIVSFLHTG